MPIWYIVYAVLALQANMFIAAIVWKFIYPHQYDRACKRWESEKNRRSQASTHTGLYSALWLPILIGLLPTTVVWWLPNQLARRVHRKYEAHMRARADRGKLDPEVVREALGLEVEAQEEAQEWALESVSDRILKDLERRRRASSKG